MFKIEDGKLIGDLVSIIHDSLRDEDRIDIIESLSCADHIIKSVADQILDGCTDNGSSGSETIFPRSEDSFTPLQAARRRVAEGASEVAKKEIKDLQRQVKYFSDTSDEWMQKYYDLKRRNEGY